MGEEQEGAQPVRGPGRPRKWANDAERVRAYRARKAVEQADVDQLRRDRRALRRQATELLAKLARTEMAALAAEHRVELLGAEIDQAAKTVQAKDIEIRWLRDELMSAREKRERLSAGRETFSREDLPLGEVPKPGAGLSRAQRRALERRNRRR